MEGVFKMDFWKPFLLIWNGENVMQFISGYDKEFENGLTILNLIITIHYVTTK